MQRLLCSLLLLAPLAVLAQQPAARAWGWNVNVQNYGQNGYGQVYGPGGYYGTYQRQQIGNTRFSTYSDPYGSSRCTTQTIGRSSFTNCY